MTSKRASRRTLEHQASKRFCLAAERPKSDQLTLGNQTSTLGSADTLEDVRR
jgi:hypothetical protein